MKNTIKKPWLQAWWPVGTVVEFQIYSNDEVKLALRRYETLHGAEPVPKEVTLNVTLH